MAQGPWSNVPNVLQDILTQKREAQHQKLIDSLALVQQQAEMENQVKQREQAAQEAKALAGYRTGQLAESAADRASREKIAAMPVREAPEGPAYTVGPTGKITASLDPLTGKPIMTRAADPRMELGFAPQGPQPQNPVYAMTDPQTGKPVLLSEGQMFTVDEKGKRVPYSGPAGAKPTAAQTGGPSSAEFNRLSILAGKAASRPGMLWGQREAPSADVAAYNQQLNNIVARYKTTPDVIKAVQNAMEEDPSLPSSEILKDFEAANPNATASEKAKFAELLTVARGQ